MPSFVDLMARSPKPIIAALGYVSLVAGISCSSRHAVEQSHQHWLEDGGLPVVVPSGPSVDDSSDDAPSNVVGVPSNPSSTANPGSPPGTHPTSTPAGNVADVPHAHEDEAGTPAPVRDASSPWFTEDAPSWAVPPRVQTPRAPASADVTHAILVSVDGLAARFLEAVIAAGNAPTFLELQSLGAWTHNARTDKTYTITLPNHTSMLTGLPVSASPGLESFRAHLWTKNTDPMPGETLHLLRFPAREYTPSAFDVAHDHGLTTALFASKSKFSLYSQSYNDAGEPDTVGEDNGRHKIDTVVINADPAAMIDSLVTTLKLNPPGFTFVHLNQPDGTGHSIGWGTPEYLAAVAQMDVLLGRLLEAIRSESLASNTALIITTDHGGVGTGHFDSSDIQNFQIPFYVMAPGVPPGDAYAACTNRFPPTTTNPEYQDPRQPLRNGDSGNLALYLLGLPPIPESVIHSAGLITNR